MNVYAASKLRNVALIGHGTSGKTSLAEALVFAAQGSKRRGSVADGNTISDFDPEEIKRQISINTSVVPCEWKGFKVNVLDTPGYFDFVGEVMASLQSVEGAVSVLCAASGLEVGAELTWEHAENFGVAQMVFINKMDRENANFAKTLEQLQNQFGNTVVPLQLPIGAADTFKGLVDLVTMKAYVFENGKAAEQPIPDELAGEAEEARAVLVEAAASADDGLTMKFLEDEPLTEEEIVHGLRLAVKERSVIPVLVGSALKDIGVTQLLDAITAYMPSAEDARVTATNANGDEIEVVPGETPGLVARVFKTLADPYVGRMTMFRVYSGTVKSDSTVYNVTRGREERVGQLFFLRGKEQIQTDAVGPGDIGVIAKLQETQTGDSPHDPRSGALVAWPRTPVADGYHGGPADGKGRRGQGVHRPDQVDRRRPDSAPGKAPRDRRKPRQRPWRASPRGHVCAPAEEVRSQRRAGRAAGALQGNTA